MHTRSSRLALAAVAALLASGCGGGGDSPPPPDTTGPQVTSVSPVDGATGIPRTGVVAITFSEAIDLASVTEASVAYRAVGGGAVAYAKGFDPATRVLTLTPSAALANYAAHTIEIGAGVKDAAGNALAAPATYGFTTADDVAPATVAASPTDEGTWDDAAVTFSWAATTDDGSGVARYRVQVASAADPAQLVATTEVAAPATAIQYDAAAAAHGAPLFARVAAVDAAGNQGAYSPWSDGIQRDAQGPVAAAPTRPAAYSTTASVTFSWLAATDAGVGAVASYDVEIATATDGSGTILSENVGTALSRTLAGADGQTLFARVRARDALDNVGAWSSWSPGATVDLAAPAVASIAPATGAAGVARTGVVSVTFSETIDLASVTAATVTYQEAGGGAVAYAKAFDPATRVLTLTPTAPLANFRDHAVRVTTGVTDLAGRALTGEVTATFRSADDVPPATLAAPTDAGTWDDATVTFSWGAATDEGSGLAGYRVQLASAADPAQVFATTDLAASATTLQHDAAAAAHGTSFFARVAALDAAGNQGAYSPWSNGIQRDAAGPVASAPSAPAAYSSSASVAFSWTAASDAGVGTVTAYEVAIATATDGSGTLLTEDVGTALGRTITGADGQTLYARVRAHDGLGNAGAWSPWSQAVTIDLTAPTLVSITPATGTSDVARAGVVSITLSEVIDLASVTPSTVTYEEDGGAAVAYAKAFDPVARVLTLTPAAPLANHRAHTVRVTSGVRDLAGHALAEGAIASFTTEDDVAPAIAAAPTDDGAWGDAALTFTWGAATDDGSGVVGYRVQVASAADASAVLQTIDVAAPTTSLEYFALAADHGASFFARVAAIDAAGNVGAYTAWSDGVQRDALGPVAATPTSPAAYTTTSVVAFSWAAASDPGIGTIAEYEFEAATATDGTGYVQQINVGTALSDTLIAADGQTIFARVRARDALGYLGAWSSWSAGVTVDLTAPTVASIAPGTGATAVARSGVVSVAFSEAIDLASVTAATVTYQQDGGAAVAYAKAFDTATKILTLTPTAPLANLRAHTVRVTAGVKDLAGHALAAESVTSFTTADDVAPAMAGPIVDAGAWDDASVTFDWAAAADDGSGVDGYVIEPAFAPTGAAVFASDFSFTPTFTLDASSPLAFDDGDVIYVRVQALDRAGNRSAWVWSDGVTLDRTAPAIPAAPQDGGESSYERSLHFAWAPSSDGAGAGVASYTIEITNTADATVHTATTTSTSYDFTYPGAIPATVTARVLAIDVFGHASDYSAYSDGILVSDQVPGAPGTPAEVSPAVYTSSLDIPFTWTAPIAGGAFADYVVQAGPTPDGPFVDVGTVAAPPFSLSGAHGMTYHLRVAARAAGDLRGAFSAPSDGITVDATQPSAPGTPAGSRGGTVLTFYWTPAYDGDSGITSYGVEILADGGVVHTATTAGTSYAFDAAGRDGQTISARVLARNGAGTDGPSAVSAGIRMDGGAPVVEWIQPSGGTTSVPTGTDVTIQFSEPMNRASVEAAFSLSYGGTSPRNGYHFWWSADSRTVTIAPDTQDPVESTNVDLLPEKTLVTVTVAATASDAAGNPLAGAAVSQFTTADDSSPSLVSVAVGGVPSPVPAAAVQGGGFTLQLTFDEEMDPTRGSVAFEHGNQRIEARYGSAQIFGVALGAGTATYATTACDLRVGDVVTVRDVQPRALEVTRAVVTAVYPGTFGPCSFTVASSASGVAYQGGGWVAVPQSSGPARPRWTSPTTLAVTYEPWVTLVPGTDTSLDLWDFHDLSWNYLDDGEAVLQVAKPVGTDATPPALLASIPAAGATAPGAGLVILRFTEPLDRSTIAAISAECLGSPCAGAYEVEYDDDEWGPLVILVPRRSPPDGETVVVHVPGSVEDLAGNPLGAGFDLPFTIAASADFGAPELLESLPPSGLAVADVWDVQLAFSDQASGSLDPLDADTVGPEDVRVVDENGRVSRGWRPEVDSASAFLRLTQPRGGLSAAQLGVGITGARSVSGVLTFETGAPHGIVPGATVTVWMYADPYFNVTDATVQTVPTPTTFTVAFGGGDWAASGGGNAQVKMARSYTVSILGIPGATGISDLHGNPMSPQVVDAVIQPGGGRVPTATDLGDLRVSAGTSPRGRELEIDLGLRDPDGGTVEVTVSLFDGATEIPLTGYGRTVVLDPSGWGWYSVPQDGGGPPTTDSAPELQALASGLYPVAITLSDGVRSTTYVREVFIWAPADVPALAGIDDGSGVVAMNAAHPPVVDGSSLSFLWTVPPTEDPDFLGLYVGTLDAIDDQGGGSMEAFLMAPGATEAVAPAALPADVYLWTVVGQKFTPGSFDLAGSAWAIDAADPLGSVFVVGPDNGLVGGAEFGGARIGFRHDQDGRPTALAGAYGRYAFEPGTGSAPVFVTTELVDHTGGAVSGMELFAYDAASGAFVMTDTSSGPGASLPMPMRGGLGGDGTFFCVAEENRETAALAVGASRYQTTGFGASLTGDFVAVSMETWGDGAGVPAEVGGWVGAGTFGAGTLAITITTSANETGGPFDVPYTVAADGLLSIDIGDEENPGQEFARGYLGGAPGAEIAALASDGSADPTATPRASWILVARAYPWSGTESAASLSGTYRFASLEAEVMPGFSQAHGANGTLSFDGAGGVTYEVATPGGPVTGVGRYEVLPAQERVVVYVEDDGGEDPLTFVVGPAFDTLLGVSTQDGSTETNVLVLTR